jgi:Tfp pilus assembly protein PilF
MRVRYQAPSREVPKWQAPVAAAPGVVAGQSALAPARTQPAAKRSLRKAAHEQWPQAIVRPVPAPRGRSASQPAFRFTPAGAAAATCALLAAAGCATIEPQASKAWKVEPVLDVSHAVQSAQGYYQLGRYYNGMRAWDKSIDAYRKAIAAEASHIEAHNGLAVALAQRGRYAESEAAFREAIALSPDSSHLRSNLGYVLLLAGKPQEAVRELRAAVKADKTDVTAIANLREAVWQLESARLAGTVTDKVMPAASSSQHAPTAAASPATATDASKQQAPAAVAMPMPVPAAEAQPRSLAQPVPAVAAEVAPAVPPSNALMVSVAAPITTASVPAPIVTSLNVPAPLVTAVVPSPAAPIAVVTAPTVPSLEQPAPVAVASTPVGAAPTTMPMAVQVLDKPTVPSLQAAPATGPITQAAAAMIAAAPPVEAASTRPTGLQWSAAEPAKPAAEPVKQRVATEVEKPRPAAVVVKAAVAPLAPAAPVAPPAAVHKSRLELSNGNGVTGMAARLRSWLTTQGVKTSRLTNDLPYNQPQTVIQYRHGHEQAAMQIAQSLPASAQALQRADLSPRTDVRVLIGRDWVQMASCLNDKTVCSPQGNAVALLHRDE